MVYLVCYCLGISCGLSLAAAIQRVHDRHMSRMEKDI